MSNIPTSREVFQKNTDACKTITLNAFRYLDKRGSNDSCFAKYDFDPFKMKSEIRL